MAAANGGLIVWLQQMVDLLYGCSKWWIIVWLQQMVD